MDLNSFHWLLTPAGQQALAEAETLQPQEADFLRLYSRLSRRFPGPLAQAALETAILRGEAASKFPLAARMYFTRPALQQATSAEVSGYRARRFLSFDLILDLGCSIGGDTLALASHKATLGMDLDPLRLAMAQANLRALGLQEKARLLRADLTAPLPVVPGPQTAIFFDPARRTAERRIFSVREYQPPLDVVRRWLEAIPAVGVKLSPGVDLAELSAYDAELEFISLDGELKEAALWFGPLKTTNRRATLLPGLHSLEAERPADLLPLSEPLGVIYEPDPAILRAGLVSDLGWRLGAVQMDADIAYLTAGSHVQSPYARAWQVEAWFPFSLKRLRAALSQRNVGRVVIKKRGSPLQPEQLAHDLHLKGDHERVVFLTHLRGRPIVILSDRMF